MAHKKGVGSTDNGRDSKSKRLGVKLFGGQHAIPGNIIVRQRGTRYHPGNNVGMGKDHTLHALVEGTVTFQKKRNNRTYVSILPEGAVITQQRKSTPKVKATPVKTPAPSTSTDAGAADKLTKIEGIGPKVQELLIAGGISTFQALSKSDFDTLKGILTDGGSRFQMMDPTTWPQQAQLAADGKWEELDVLQDKLDGGRIVSEEE